MKAWLDDFNFHAKTEEELLTYLDEFFSICAEHNLFLSALKCKCFATKIRWCGRLISGTGYTMDPSRVEGLKDMCVPEPADELCQFVHCCRWMSVSIPDFLPRVASPVDMLEEAYKK